MQLTKTDFIQYLNCPESLWLYKNKPEEYVLGEFSLFLEKLIKEGYEIEAYAKELFPEILDLSEGQSALYTLGMLKTSHKLFFQPTFSIKKGAFAIIDVLERLDDGSFHLYEIKSSTKIKKDKKHNHLNDVCFQKYVVQESGFVVSKVSMIILNKEFVKKGEIDPSELLEIIDVSDEVEKMYSGVVNEINAAINFINKESINTKECSCKFKTRSNHCDVFEYFNPNVPEYSIYQIRLIREKKVIALVNDQITSIEDIPDNFEINPKQRLQVDSFRQKEPIINKVAVKGTLENLTFPLHFIDYETYASAVPKVDKLKPHNHFVFQVSIHTLLESGELNHFEWLGDKMELPLEMLEKMKNFTGEKGTFICWFETFEKTRNKEMIEWIPEYAKYLSNMNENVFDLMKIFNENYVDYRFRGYTSLKKVLPVVCPNTDKSYGDMEVQDGTMALDTWGRMIDSKNGDLDVDETRKNLLEYCKLDTEAMVNIYKYLKDKVGAR